MGKALQIRDVPDELLQILRVNATREGSSLSRYALKVLREHSSHPSIQEILNRSRSGWSQATSADVLTAIHEGREVQEDKILKAISNGD